MINLVIPVHTKDEHRNENIAHADITADDRGGLIDIEFIHNDINYAIQLDMDDIKILLTLISK